MASNVLGRIAVTLGLDSAAFEQNLSKAAKLANANAKEIEKGFKSLGGTFDSLLGPLGQLGGAFGSTLSQMGSQIGSVVRQFGPLGASFGGVGLAAAGVGGALVAAGAAAVGLAISGASVVEEIEHLSQKTGISRDDLVAWKAAAEASGVSLDQFTVGMRFFEKSLGGTSAAAKEIQAVLKSIGVTTKDPEEALLQIAEAFSRLPDGAQKSAIAIALFGRAGTEMIPVLDQGRAGIEKWQQAAKQLGPDISEGAVKAAQAWKDATEKMSLSWDKLKVSMVPVLTTLAGTLSILQQMATYDVSHVLDFGYKGHAAPAPDLNKVFAGAEAIVQKQMLDDAQKQYDLVKARGPMELKLLETQKEISEALKTDITERIKHATVLQSEIPALQKAAELERARTAEMERRAEVFKKSLADLEANHGAARPSGYSLAAQHIRQGSLVGPRDENLMFGPQPTQQEKAPDIGTAAPSNAGGIQVDTSGLSLLTSLTEQYKSYLGQTTQEITAYWDSQIKAMNALLLASHANQEVVSEMNKEAQALKANALAGADAEAMKAAKNAVREGTASFQQAWQVAFDSVKSGGAKLTQTLGTAFGNMLNEINHGLAELIVTGKGLNFKEIAQKFGVTMVQSLMQKGESSLLDALHLGKPDGTSSKPFYVTFAGAGGLAGSLGGGGDSGGVISSLLGSLFGGFLAGGGDVTPGQSYIVGDSGPELFTPSSAGTVTPNSGLKSGSSATINYLIDARGADAGVEQRVRVAIRESENRAVMRSVSTVNELSKRR